MKRYLSIVTATALVAALSGCSSDSEDAVLLTETEAYSALVPSTGSTLPYTVLDNNITDGKVPSQNMEVRNGGYGSAAAAHPTLENRFYALTDRGPNAVYTGADGKGKMFPTPEYTPRIGLFEIEANGSVKKIKDILLKRPDGTNITGLPNTSALGGTGETPYDKYGNTLRDENGDIRLDDYGLDGEGLAALKDGTFWVSDEYGPHMVHFDANGKEIDRINPFVDDNRTSRNLPAEFAYRRANRGMEGLTITPDQKTLVGIMQSTMDLPTSGVHTSTITRIVTINLETNETKQYLYKQEKAANSNSEIVALSDDEFLVIERDGAFYNGGPTAADPDAQKYIYRIKLSSGTELEALSASNDADFSQDATIGLTIGGQTLEEVVYGDGSNLAAGWSTLAAKGIYPVAKELVVDMVAETSYPHDKMEGLVVFKDGNLGVLNDDDFATWSTSGVLEQKYLDVNYTKVDQNTLYVVKNPLLTGSKLTKLASFDTNTEGGSEIVAYDATTKRMYTTNGAANAIDIINISNPSAPAKVSSIDLSSYGTGVNSVAAYNGVIAAAVEVKSTDGLRTNDKGKVVFFDTNGAHIQTVEVGYLPDMVTFNEDGSKVVVANEGEPNGDYSVDPEGTVGVIDMASYTYEDIKLDGLTTDATDGTAVRLGATPSNDQSKDLEPEFITVSGNYAYVTLQENNAMAKINLTNNTVEYIKSYGVKSYEADSGNTIDIEEEGQIKMKSYSGLFGLYMPDSIASYSYNNATYLVTANEGDGREYPIEDVNATLQTGDALTDENKISKLTLDPSIADVYADENDLKVVVDMGDTDNDGDYDKLYAYGARSFTIWDENGDLVWDSKDQFSKIVAAAQPALFNQDEGDMDGRSGNKGVEPEALALGEIDGKTYAFVGFERQNGIVVYDITNPAKAKFIDYIETESEGDISPEGMRFIPASQSPNKKNLLLVSYEMSGSTAIYEVK